MQFFLVSRLIASNRYIPIRKTQLGFLIHNAFLDFRSFTSVNSAEPNDKLKKRRHQEGDPFTVSYLINSCGLSLNIAVHASKCVRLENYDQPNSVLNLLKNYGFSDTQVSRIVKFLPRILQVNPEAILLPKLKFLQSIGISDTDLPEFLISNPLVLVRSLDEFLIPRYEILKRVLSNDKDVIKSLKCGIRSLRNVADDVVPNMKLLRELVVPQSSVCLLVTNFPDVAFMRHSEFVEVVKFVREMEFDPAKSSFVLAIQVLAKLKPYKWKSKLETYERWGWSKNVALSAFRRYPNCMLYSEEKINKVMNFLLNEMGYPSEAIAVVPAVLALNLEKRIIPRCLIVQTLKSKGLVKNDLRLGTFLLKTEEDFKKCFVARFQDPDKGEMGPLGIIES